MSFYFQEAPGPPCLLCDSSFPRAPYPLTRCVTQLTTQMAAEEDLPQVAVRRSLTRLLISTNQL